MKPAQRILCPTDFSGPSRRARDVALRLAAECSGAFAALHAVPPPSRMQGGSALGERRTDDAREEMDDFLASAGFGSAAPEPSVVEGDAVERILDAAKGWPADLLVMGTHGERERHGWGLGSVTERVLRRAPCPTLVVPPRWPVPAAAQPLFRRLLCPSEFSEASDHALAYALAFARPGARLTLLHVLEWFPGRGDHPDLTVPEYQLDLSEQARARLRHSVPPDVRPVCRPQEVVAIGQPHREILRVAREQEVDLIVLGVHGRRGLDQSLAGATVSHVIRESHCPVLAVQSGHVRSPAHRSGQALLVES